MNPEISIKIRLDGKIIVERGDDKSNQILFSSLASFAKNKEELRNFLFQWEGREILVGDYDLCG